MSKSNGQDCYLRNLPSNLNDYGLNKTLIIICLCLIVLILKLLIAD